MLTCSSQVKRMRWDSTSNHRALALASTMSLSTSPKVFTGQLNVFKATENKCCVRADYKRLHRVLFGGLLRFSRTTEIPFRYDTSSFMLSQGRTKAWPFAFQWCHLRVHGTKNINRWNGTKRVEWGTSRTQQNLKYGFLRVGSQLERSIYSCIHEICFMHSSKLIYSTARSQKCGQRPHARNHVNYFTKNLA